MSHLRPEASGDKPINENDPLTLPQSRISNESPTAGMKPLLSNTPRLPPSVSCPATTALPKLFVDGNSIRSVPADGLLVIESAPRYCGVANIAVPPLMLRR